MLGLILPAGILVATGLLTLYGIAQNLFFLQLTWVAVGVAVAAPFFIVDWRAILSYRWFIGGVYVVAVAMLVFVYFVAEPVRGVRSWLSFGPVNFQPVELAKIALILIFAGYFSRRHLEVARWKSIFISFLFFVVPAGLTAIQPDLGSAVVLFGIWLGFLLFSGLPKKRVITFIFIFLALGVLLWFSFLEDYHKDRIIGVFYPERDALGVNYSVIQSKIAIGSAGFWGKGYGQGTQTQLGFLTEPAGDFIFPAVVEEFGVFGGLAVIGAFLALVFGILSVGIKTKRNFERFVILGTAAVFSLQFFLNVGSSLGFTPVVGLTFPFLSYGGSSIVTSFFLLSLIGAIARSKHA